MVPGEVIAKEGQVEINAGLPVVELDVTNTGDRKVMVGSHYHFYEVNDALRFDRERARGHRLDLLPGVTALFEPGQTHRVRLVPYGGRRVVQGFQSRVNGPL